MKARMPAGFGRPDMNALMRQAQKMQEDMKAKQAELEAAEYTGSAAGPSPSSPRLWTRMMLKCWKIWWLLPSTQPSSRWTKLPKLKWAS